MTARDKQVATRTTQEAYDWVTAQAAALGLSHSAVLAILLEQAAQQGWTLAPWQVKVPNGAVS